MSTKFQRIAAPPVSSSGPRLASWIEHRQRSMLRSLVGVAARPGIVSLAGGLPAPELFPREEYAEALARVLRDDPLALQYRPMFEPLREHVVRLMERRGVTVRADQVLLTTGAQQGLAVLSGLLLEHGGEVAMEKVSYTGMHTAVAPAQPRILALSSDLEHGLDVEELAERLEQGARPAFLYVIPDGHNPLGVSLSAERRERLIELAHRHALPIVEDDPYGLLTFDHKPLAPLRALDSEWVLYVGSFSKILAPALRLGFMVLPDHLLAKAPVLKEAFDLECSALTQRAVSSYLDEADLDARLSMLRRAYGERCTAMTNALADALPDGSRHTQPRGGMFVWVELPEGADTMVLFERALEDKKVAFVPGSAFAAPCEEAAGAGRSALRLSFATLSPDTIGQAVADLGEVISDHLAEPGSGARLAHD